MIPIYVSLDEFKSSPTHGIDCSTLVTDGDAAAQDAALTTMLLAAEALVNGYCDVDTFEATTTTETFYTTLNRRGEVIVRPRNRPITGVTSVKYRTHPSQAWTSVALTSIEFSERSITLRASMGDIVVNGTSLYSPSYITPHEFDRLAKIPLTVEVTYTSGYSAEAMPEAIKMATILYCADLIGERGSVSVTADGSPSTMGGNPYDRTRTALAETYLKRYRR